MSTVTHPTTPAKSPAKPSTKSPVNPAHLAAAWAALAKVAGKEGDRAALLPGTAHTVNLAFLGEVDGERVGVEFFADLTIGHDSVRASSVTPDQSHVVAHLLGLMNKATRDKALRELPERFAANGNQLPDVDATLIDAAENMLARLRSKVEQPVKGSVACRYRLIDAEKHAAG